MDQIKPRTKRKKKKRVGRGGKRGAYSGRGIKGQKSRAGRKIRPQMRDILKKIPKKRGYRFKSRKEKPVVVNLKDIEKKFKAGEKVTPLSLLKKGLIKKTRKRPVRVKLLGAGALTKKLLVSGCQISNSAKKKVEDAGGKLI
jgi:large subunit ribosomal protein L15